MKKFLSKCWTWLKQSSRYKHLGYGILIGLGSDNIYCAAYVGVGIASALEYKDKAWGGAWDWFDWLMTLTGTIIGFGVRLLIKLTL